jgi:hypothetical protein
MMWYDATRAALGITGCFDAECSESASNTVAVEGADIGRHVDLALAPSGVPHFVFRYDGSVVDGRCVDVRCGLGSGPRPTGAEPLGLDAVVMSSIIEPAGNGRGVQPALSDQEQADGLDLSLSVRPDGTAVVSGKVGNDIMVATYATPFDPDAGLQSQVFLQPGSTGFGSMAIGPDDRPVIVGSDGSRDLLITRCGDPQCLTVASERLTEGTFYDSAVTIGADGLPMIVSTDNVGEDAQPSLIRVMSCLDPGCTTSIDMTLPFGAQYYNSMAIGSDGVPIIAASQFTEPHFVSFHHCGTASCNPNFPSGG